MQNTQKIFKKYAKKYAQHVLKIQSPYMQNMQKKITHNMQKNAQYAKTAKNMKKYAKKYQCSSCRVYILQIIYAI